MKLKSGATVPTKRKSSARRLSETRGVKMKRLLILLIIASSCYAQNVRRDDLALVLITQNTSFGTLSYLKPAPGAIVTIGIGASSCSVTNTPSGSVGSCSPLASLCSSISDITCNQPNPTNADNLGNYGFWLIPGTYQVAVSGLGVNGKVVTYSMAPVTATAGTVTVTGGPPVNGNLAGFSGPTTITPANLVGDVSTSGGLSTTLALNISGPHNLCLLNGLVYVNGTGCYTTLEAAYAVAGNNKIIVPTGFSETMLANFTVNKPNTTIEFEGTAAINMQSFQIIVPQGTHGVSFNGTIPFGGANHTTGAVFTYTGTSSAFQIGGAVTTTREFGFNNISVILNPGNAGATALSLLNVIYFHMDSDAVTGQTVVGSFGFVLNGTGNFTGTGMINNPLIAFVGTGISGTIMNSVVINGGTIQTFTVGGIGLDFSNGDKNSVYGTDFESNAISVRFGASAQNNYLDIRSEANTNDVTALAGSARNVVRASTLGIPLVVSDAGTNNHFSLNVDGDFNQLKVAGVTNATGLQVFSATPAAGTCPTAAAVGSTCVTAGFTLPVFPEPDVNYRVSCQAKTITAGVPVVITTTNFSSNTFTITLAALTAAAANATAFDCFIGHN